jgi:hypothetical protein
MLHSFRITCAACKLEWWHCIIACFLLNRKRVRFDPLRESFGIPEICRSSDKIFSISQVPEGRAVATYPFAQYTAALLTNKKTSAFKSERL